MPSVESRTSAWLGRAVELLATPVETMPVDQILDSLTWTFETSVCSWHWSHPDGSFGMTTAPRDALLGSREALDLWLTGTMFDSHALITWHAVTGSVAPQTMARVPSRVVPSRRRRFVEGLLAGLDLDNQLSLIYRSSPTAGERSFVIGRGARDFDDDDLVVARVVQHGLRCIEAQTAVIRRILDGGGTCSTSEGLDLTARELSVLQLVADGHSSRAVGRRLGCAPRTVEKHLERSYRKLGVRDRMSAVSVLRAAGLLGPADARHDDTGASQFRGPVPAGQSLQSVSRAVAT